MHKEVEGKEVKEMFSGVFRWFKGVWKMFRPDTTMFRCRYKGDNGALQNTLGWGWTEARQPGLTFLKWYYVADNDPNQVTWTVVAPLELHIERNWSKKKDREIEALPINALRFATGMLKEPYDVHELRKMMNIPEPKEVMEVLDLNDLFAVHDSADQIRAERDARELTYQAARDQAMMDIEAILGADLTEEEERELLDLGLDTKVKTILSSPPPKQADEEEEFVLCLDLSDKPVQTISVTDATNLLDLGPMSSKTMKSRKEKKQSTMSTTVEPIETRNVLNLWDDESPKSNTEFVLDLSL